MGWPFIGSAHVKTSSRPSQRKLWNIAKSPLTYKEASKHYEAYQHEKAAHHAHLAHGHSQEAIDAETEAAKSHLERYGKK